MKIAPVGGWDAICVRGVPKVLAQPTWKLQIILRTVSSVGSLLFLKMYWNADFLYPKQSLYIKLDSGSG